MLSLTAFYKIIAIIGIIELAATQIIFKIMHTSFIPAIGIGQLVQHWLVNIWVKEFK